MVAGQQLCEDKTGSVQVAAPTHRFFNCCMFLGLDASSKSLVYFNLDPLVSQQPTKGDFAKNVNGFQHVSKFYGFGQQILTRCKIYPAS